MPRPKALVPKLCRHKGSSRGVVRLNGTDHYLGPWPAGADRPPPAVRAAYDKLIAEWLANNRLPVPQATAPSPAAGPTVGEVILGFWRYAQEHYRLPDGAATNEQQEVRLSLRPVRALFGDAPAGAFGPKKLAAVREEMIRAGWCRTLINRRVDRVKRCFKWAASQELVPVAAYQSLRTVPGLQAGRTRAREPEPVTPVPEADYAATLPHLPRVPRAMAELQRWTGMRPGEVCRLRLSEIDRGGPVWVYRPSRHKSRHRGKTRSVPIGPKGQAVIMAFLAGRVPRPAGVEGMDLTHPTARLAAAALFERAGRPADAALLRDPSRAVEFVGGSVIDPEAYLFNPGRDREDRLAALRLARKSKVPPSQACRRKGRPARVPGLVYTTTAYCHAVARACGAAGVPRWAPNRIRHWRASEVRRAFGLETAGAVLGHSKMSATEVYAERDAGLATRVAAETG